MFLHHRQTRQPTQRRLTLQLSTQRREVHRTPQPQTPQRQELRTPHQQEQPKFLNL
jgi:hypothetical protein